MKEVFDKLGGRKFVLGAFSIVLASVFCVLKIIDQVTWFQALTFCLGFTVAGNVAEKFSGKNQSMASKEPLVQKSARLLKK